MDPANLLMLSKRNNINLLKLIELEEEFEQSVDSFCYTYKSRKRKRKAPSDWLIKSDLEANFKHYFRMEKEFFDILVDSLPELKNIEHSESIPRDKRIAIALYTLGKTDGNAIASKLFSIPESLVVTILDDFCLEVKRVLSHEYMPEDFLTPNKLEECKDGFKEMGFPQCLGAIGVRHLDLSLRKPHLNDCHTDDWCSNILFALVDYRSRFLYVDDSSSADCTPTQAFEKSSLKKALDNMPIILLGDASFELSTTVMTPFNEPKRTLTKQFNATLHKARKVVPEAFEPLKARFPRVTKVSHEHKRRFHILICCCILHNFLNCYESSVPKFWRDDEVEQFESAAEIKNNERAENVRIAISKYVSTIK